MTDLRVLHALADQMDADLGLPDLNAAREELAEFGPWNGDRGAGPEPVPVPPLRIAPGQAVLATWHLRLDNGRSQVGEPYLAGTAHRATVRLSQAAATRIGLTPGALVSVSTAHGAVSLPVQITQMPDGVVWLPTNSGASRVRRTLRAAAGDVVSIGVVPSTSVAQHTSAPVSAEQESGR